MTGHNGHKKLFLLAMSASNIVAIVAGALFAIFLSVAIAYIVGTVTSLLS